MRMQSPSKYQQKHRTLLIAVLCLLLVSILITAQTNQTNRKSNTLPATPTPKTNSNPKTKIVKLLRADRWEYDQLINPDAQVVKGNVVFNHEGMQMQCDSALFFDQINSFEAFGNVKMEQGDTLFVYSDYLYYDGTTRLAKLRHNVKLENNDVTLYTDSLDYDRIANFGYYFNGGVIVDPENELRSWNGKYNTTTKDAIFNDKVVLTNPKFVLTSELLHYNTSTYIALITSPSIITAEDSTKIYTRSGWYNTKIENSELLKRSVIVNESKSLIGDSILYDRKAGIAHAYGNIFSIDTIRKAVLKGEYGFFNEKTEYSFVTDSALLIDYSRKDSMYIHADSLFTWKDSTFRMAKGYSNARFFRNTAQGVCDTFIYSERDTALTLINNPVLWHQKYQIKGDRIIAYMNDSTITWAHVIGNAFAQEFVDTTLYNQIVGREIKAYFEESDLRKIDALGDAKTNYYPIESDSTITGLNYLESTYLTLLLKEQKLEKLRVWPSPKGTTTPLPLIEATQKFLPLFKDLEYIRPTSPEDVFRNIRMRKEDIQEPKRKRRQPPPA